MNQIRLTVTKINHISNQKVGRIKLDFMKEMRKYKEDQEKNVLKMGEHLTDEFMYLGNRIKQKLLYQIGLIDDPWKEDQGFILDDVYSQDHQNPLEISVIKRPKSQTNLRTMNRGS